jgi:hypothetical protein
MATWVWLSGPIGLVALALLSWSAVVEGQRSSPPSRDAIMEAQAPPAAAPTPLPHDRGDRFDASKADPLSSALDRQPDKGEATGFDFYRDPLNAKRPMQTFDEVMKADIAAKAAVMAAQRKLLETRYIMTPKLTVKASARAALGSGPPGSPDARPPSRTPHQGARRGTDEDIHAAWHQGQPAIPARRAAPDIRRQGGVLQSRPERQSYAS